MSNWRSQFDMAHAFATDFLKGNFNAALFADNTFVLHPLVFATQAFVVLNRAKNTCTEQTITLRLKCPIVDGFWLFNFTKGPRPNAFRRSNRNLDLVEPLCSLRLTEDFYEFVHLSVSLKVQRLVKFNVKTQRM